MHFVVFVTLVLVKPLDTLAISAGPYLW